MKRKTIIKITSLFCILTMLMSLTGCNATYLYTDDDGNEYYAGTATQFDSYASISIFAGGSDELMDEALELCADFDLRFSTTMTAGETYTLNRNSTRSDDPLTDYQVSGDIAAVISKALEMSALTDGMYDITIGPVSKLWDFGADSPSLPSQREIDEALPLVGWQNVTLENNMLSFSQAGMELDFGSIARGYIADEVKKLLVERGVTSAIINLGGNIVCVGERPDGIPFSVGVQKPFAETAETVAVMEISDMSVVSTGIYSDCFSLEGVLYHHILDHTDGYPINNGLVGITVIGESSFECDALSTACFSLGLEKGLELIDSTEGYHAIFVTGDYQIVYSKDFTDYINVVDYVEEANPEATGTE